MNRLGSNRETVFYNILLIICVVKKINIDNEIAHSNTSVARFSATGFLWMTHTDDVMDQYKNKCQTMEADANSRSQYTIGSNDFIRK